MSEWFDSQINPSSHLLKLLEERIRKTFSCRKLKRGYLVGTSVHFSSKHTLEIVNSYPDVLDPLLRLIKQRERGLQDEKKVLKGPGCHYGFKRLN